MNANDAIATLANMNVVDAHGRKLRHQPLVLLHAIERVLAGGDRWVRYESICNALRDLLAELADGGKQPDPSGAMNALMRPTAIPGTAPVPVWEIEDHAELPRKRGRKQDVSAKTLSERRTHVGLPEAFAHLLMQDTEFAKNAVAVLLTTYFPKDDHGHVLDRVRAARARPSVLVWRVYCRHSEQGKDYAQEAEQGGYVALGGDGSESAEQHATEASLAATFGAGDRKRAGEVWRLYRESRPNDWVLMPSRENQRVYVGRIGQGGYRFEAGDPGCPFPHRWPVEWLGSVRYADARKLCGGGVLSPGALAGLLVAPAAMESLLARAQSAPSDGTTEKRAVPAADLAAWAERGRRTARLARAAYDHAATRGTLSADTALGLCRLTWITRGAGGPPDPLGGTVSPTYWQVTLLPALVELFGLPSGLQDLAAAAAQVAARTGLSGLPALVTDGIGFTNLYNAFRNAAGPWLRRNERQVLLLLQRARDLESDAAGRRLAEAVATLPPIPRGNAPSGGMRAEQILTPVLACLDPRGRFPLLNGAPHVRRMLKQLGVADASLAAQHDALVDSLDPGDPQRCDAFALDMHGLGPATSVRGTLTKSQPIEPKPTEGKTLAVRDASDIEAIARGGRRRVRRVHNEMTNSLIAEGERLGLTVREGVTSECLFDALIEDYKGDGRDLLVEVKSTAERGVLRLAVGQLLDYRRGLERATHTDLAVLLPAKPEPEVAAFLRDVQVALLLFSGGTTGTLIGGVTPKK